MLQVRSKIRRLATLARGLFFASLLAAAGLEWLLSAGLLPRASMLLAAVLVVADLASTSVQPVARNDKGFLVEAGRQLERIAESEEVANLVTFLASDLAFFVNGTMIEIDGGQEKPLMDRLRDR